MNIVEYSVSNYVASITLNRPDKRNALNPELIAALKDAFHHAENDPQVKVIILQGKGDAFCAGADLSYLQKLQQFSYEENLSDSLSLKDLFWQIYTAKKIVMAKVKGPAYAGGFGLATVCDLCFATEDATFSFTEVKIGFVPALVMVFLLRKIGDARARPMLLTGNIFTGKELANTGLVYKTFTKDNIDEEVIKFAMEMIRNNSNEAMMLTKKAMTDLGATSLNDALHQAAITNAVARNQDDCRRGIAAFLNKQKIDWTKTLLSD